MYEAIPMCPVCKQNEVGSLYGGTEDFCSSTCEAAAQAEMAAMRIDADEWDSDPHAHVDEFRAEYFEDEADYYESWQDECEDGEPEGSFDLSDDAEALASAGWGTDEDYGYYGEDF